MTPGVVYQESALPVGIRIQVVSTNGFRLHVLGADCWCRPSVEAEGDGQVIVHRGLPCTGHDDRPRMTVYSDRLAQSG